jgi:hypothetical protein
MSRPPGVDDFEYRGRKDGLLLAECWCQGDMVLVRPEDVRAGLTGSCGAARCGPEFAASPSSSAVRNSGAPRDSVRPGIERPPRLSGPGALASTCTKATDMNHSSPPTPPDPIDLLIEDLVSMRGVYGDDEEMRYCAGAKDGIDAAIALVKLRTGRTEPARS